jgi:hypothetical protein
MLGTTVAESAPPATQVRSFHLDAPLAHVIPLFTALGERDWAEGWDPEMLSGKDERGSAWRTFGHAGSETVWIVTDYRPAEGRASYARVAYSSNIGLVDVTCTVAAGGGTDVSVRYTLTPLTSDGKAFVDDFLRGDSYSKMIEEWRASTSALLARQTERRP